MPKIPQATSKQALSGKAPSVKVSPGSFAVTGQAIEKAGKALSVVSARFKDLQNLEEYTSGMTGAKRALKDLEVKAAADPDIYTMDQRYSQEINKIKANAAKGISDRETQIRFGVELDNFSRTKEFNIRTISRGKQIDRSKATLLNDMDQSRQDYYDASSPLERKQLSNQVEFRLSEHARLGVITEKSAAETKKAWDDDVRIGQVSYDASIDPALAKKNIEDGAYKLNAKEKEEALNEVAALVKKREARKEVDLFRGFNANEENVVNQIEDLKVSDIDRLELMGSIGSPNGISKKFAVVARRAITSAKAENPTVDVGKYNEILDEFVNLKVIKKNKKKRTVSSLEDIMKFRVKVMSSYADGDILQGQMQTFLKDVSQVYADKLTDKAEENLKLADPAPWFDIFDWTKNYSDDLPAARMRIAESMLEKIEGGKDPQEAATLAIDEEKLNSNEMYRLYKGKKKGDPIETPAGTVIFDGLDEDGEPMIKDPE